MSTPGIFLKSSIIGLLTALLISCGTDSVAEAQPLAINTSCDAGKPLGESETGLNITRLCIDIKASDLTTKTLSFDVEIAATQAEQAKGLMFRTQLQDDKGMIFPFSHPKPASFWMRNTVISLDIIFVNEDGSIANIAENTEPYSLESIPSANPVIAVLEVRAGLTKELNIKQGDIIRWRG